MLFFRQKKRFGSIMGKNEKRVRIFSALEVANLWGS